MPPRASGGKRENKEKYWYNGYMSNADIFILSFKIAVSIIDNN